MFFAGLTHALVMVALYQTRLFLAGGAVWVGVFGLAAVALCTFAFLPWSRAAFWSAGFFVVAAWSARSIWLLVDIPFNIRGVPSTPSSWSNLIGVVGFGVAAAASARVWVTEIQDWHTNHWAAREARRAIEDRDAR